MRGSPARTRPRGWLPRAEIVTGERLQSLAEISFVPAETASFQRGLQTYAPEAVGFEDAAALDEHELARLSASRVLFVYTHALDAFCEHVWPRLEGESYVLITHNSDDAVDETRAAWIDRAGAKLHRWFAQNTLVSHPKLVPLPIGIANAMWRHGDLRAVERAVAAQAGKPKRELLYVQLDPSTHPERQAALETVAAAFPGRGFDRFQRRRFRSYLSELALHRFCLCPRGNGADSHRFWESQYLDVTPIVRRSASAEHWQASGLPVLIVDEWAEVTPARLESEAALLSGGERSREPLLLSHYQRLVREAAGL